MPLAVIIVLIIFFIIPTWLFLFFLGIKLCNKNNTLGILILFIALNIFGLILGLCLISNVRQKEKEILDKKLNKLLKINALQSDNQ